MHHKQRTLVGVVLAATLLLAAPSATFAHVGHGDEFQAQGGIQKVKVNPETDAMLGIVVTPIAQPAQNGKGALIPTTALVESDGKKLVFVQYDKFYEPVPVTTGATQGELIEVTEGLSVGEKLVTQGGLSLYAESRKTQAAPSAAASASPQDPVTNAHAQADAQGKPHSHDAAGNMNQQSSGLPMGVLAAVGGGAVLMIGAIVAIGAGRKKKSTFSNKKDGGF